MKTFILGFTDPSKMEPGDLIEFESVEDAGFLSEEWCSVDAETLEEAKSKYEETFLAWRGQQSSSKFNP